MRIYFEKIPEEGLEIDFSDSFETSESFFNINSFNGTIYAVNENFILTGNLNITIKDSCDRCLRKFNEDIEEKILIEIVKESSADTKTEEIELKDEDMGLYFVSEEHIDLEEIISQEAVLLRPVKRLCDQECKGLCPICGTNLNEEYCSCKQEKDDRWADLKKLLENKNRNEV
ncbi:MAG: DUF177 domain-containing protein [Flexistipes sinusarabici]|uniref:DUF177 domain-containing protein n=1 Tax=Flexistipes sinusarabici TaxID=2352 RepID=A0A5D0MT65_FLESI|nr:DUF177 domain-containing protein [Flexistipes sinusarabici]TYB35229.1 MAG: DUF177 domain-containing protein [Flexistipes sinusarabici]